MFWIVDVLTMAAKSLTFGCVADGVGPESQFTELCVYESIVVKPPVWNGGGFIPWSGRYRVVCAIFLESLVSEGGNVG